MTSWIHATNSETDRIYSSHFRWSSGVARMILIRETLQICVDQSKYLNIEVEPLNANIPNVALGYFVHETRALLRKRGL